jgi:hypothetical protein
MPLPDLRRDKPFTVAPAQHINLVACSLQGSAHKGGRAARKVDAARRSGAFGRNVRHPPLFPCTWWTYEIKRTKSGKFFPFKVCNWKLKVSAMMSLLQI